MVMMAGGVTGILSSSDARRFLVLASPLHPFGCLEASRVSRSASFSLRSGWRAPLLEGVVQAVRSAAVLAKAHPFGCHEARSPKRRTWRAGVLPASSRVRSWRELSAQPQVPAPQPALAPADFFLAVALGLSEAAAGAAGAVVASFGVSFAVG